MAFKEIDLEPENAEKTVCEHLKSHCLGIGEVHSEPDGRLMAIELMNRGLVTNMFMELPNSQPVAAAIAAVKQIATHNAINGLADYNDLQTPNHIAHRTTAFTTLSAVAPEAAENSIRLSDVILYSGNVPVWAADVCDMGRTAFPDRHQDIYNCAVQKTFLTGMKGCLFLWGRHHFTETGSGGKVPFEETIFSNKKASDTPLHLWFPFMQYVLA